MARSRVRREHWIGDAFPHDLASSESDPVVEPRLVPLLAALPERQRVAVYLVHGCRWPTPDVADLLGVSVSTVRNHADRGLNKLRQELKVTDNDQ